MAICEKINILVVSFTIFLATLWFVLIVQLSNPVPNYAKQNGNFKNANKVELLTVPLHKTAENYDSLDLIQVINNSQPHTFNAQAILLVTSEWWGKDYQHFMQLLSNSRTKDGNFQVPLYLLKQINKLNYYNHRTLKVHSRNMLQLFKSCMETQNIKRLSILAYEQGALLTLLALSDAKSSLLQSIDKIVLINPFNPDHQLFQNDPKSLVKTIQRNIFEDPARTATFSKLRIIIINTFRTIYPEQAEVRQYFNFAFQDTTGILYHLNSTLSISSKALWNVHCTLQIHQYFRYEPFTSLLLQLFLEDHKEKLSIKAIEYLLRYRELWQVKVMSESTRRRYLSNCQVLHLQTLQINSAKLYKDCTFITVRQRYYYTDAILVLFSDTRFDIYAQQFQKITPYSTKQEKYIYVITNLKEINELIIINPSKKAIGFKITSLYKTQDNSITSFNSDHKTVIIEDQEAVLMLQSCEGWFPIFGLGSNENYKQIMQWQAGNCFMQLQQRHIYPAWFRYNWNIIRNLIIFTLFSTHVISKLTFNRFYTQLVLNFAILSYTLNHFYLFESMIVTSTSTAIELLSKGITKVSNGIGLGGSYAWLIILLPAICEFIAIQYGDPNYMNLQKILWAQVLWVNSQSGFLITIIKCYFMHDIYKTNSASIYSLILLALWQISNIKGSSLHRNNQLAVSKRRMTDTLFLFMLCLSLGEEASVIHQLINFYMITHLLLAAGEMANGIMDQT